MNQNGKRQMRKNDGTLLTTLVVVGGAIVAGAAVFYGVAGLMKVDMPPAPSTPFVLEVPHDFVNPTTPSDANQQGIPEVPTPVEPEKAPVKEPEKAPEPTKKTQTVQPPTDTAPASSTQQGLTDKVEGQLYVRPADGKIQKTFSMGELVYSETLGDYRTHNGVDISAPVGAKVRAMSDGEVTALYNDARLGTVLEITHKDGMTTRYCNLMPQLSAGVQVGAKVKMGDTVAGVGETALSEIAEAPHLHVEMSKGGKYVNPETMFK